MNRTLAVLACAAFALSGLAQDRSSLADILSFERAPKAGRPSGWNASSPEHIFADEKTVHGGKWSVRIERPADAATPFSGITFSLPMDFAGKAIELRGFVRTEDAAGFAALWMREDGDPPQTGSLAFDSMQRLSIKGTTDWHEYSISVPVHADGRRLFIGFLLSGAGKAWADDLQLLVDGKPVWEAPKVERVKTVIDTDHEFDGGSKIAFTELSAVQIANLSSLGKIWGFLKYHHPEIAAGRRHWDYELFRVLPAILKAADREATNAALAAWIAGLGDVKACQPCATLATKELHLKPPVEWIQSEAALGRELSRALQGVYRNRSNGKQFYVSLTPLDNPAFQNEPAYAKVKLPDAGYQLLALYRFWNIIQYWFPDRDMIGEDWDKVLAEFIPRVALANNSNAFQREMMAVIARIHDTHANLWSSLRVRPPGGSCQIPVVVRFVENRAVVTGYADAAAAASVPLKRGDVIEAVDGAAVTDLVREWTPYYAASNEPTALRDMARSLTNGVCGEAKVRLRRGGETIEATATRQSVTHTATDGNATHDVPGPTFRLLSKDVAYLKLSSVKSADAAKYVEGAAGTKGLVIDIRNYPSEFVVFTLGALLVERVTPFVRFTSGDLANPGAFHYFNEPLSIEPAKPHYGGKVVILVDEVTQSSAEYTSMAFRASPNAFVIGSTTAGADGNVSQIPLPGGLSSMISGLGVSYPDKRPTQRVGIVPDLEVKPTLAGVRAGRDELLEAALRKILGAEVPAEEIEKLARAGRE